MAVCGYLWFYDGSHSMFRLFAFGYEGQPLRPIGIQGKPVSLVIFSPSSFDPVPSSQFHTKLPVGGNRFQPDSSILYKLAWEKRLFTGRGGFGKVCCGTKENLKQAFEQAKTQALPSTAKGMEAMRLMAAGYSSREIGERMEASDKLVCAWVSKTRKFLKGRREFMEFAREYGY